VNAPLPGYDPAEVGRLRSALGSEPDIYEEYSPKTAEQYQEPYVNGAEKYDITQKQADEIAAETALSMAPARLTDIPTSTTDVGRPRTVAAGYDEARQVMTVMFRDGTLYNYYQVDKGEWSNFSNSISKGRPWLNTANSKQGADGLFIGKPRGPANLQGAPEDVVNDIYRIARTSQVRYANYKPRRISLTDSSGKRYTERRLGTVSTRVKYSSGLSPNSSRTKLGTNPAAKNGRNPYQK